MGTGRKKGPGGGGAALNFKVVGNPQPVNPKENTIWLNTDVKITGYSFAAEQPEMQPGEVWISTGTKRQVAFNALKKNSLMVYPISAKQMMEDGALVDVTAKIWKNGEWNDLNSLEYVLKDGAFTKGSWDSSSTAPGLGAVSFENGQIHFDVDGGTVCRFYTTEKFDTTGKTELVFCVPKMEKTDEYAVGGKLHFGISDQKDGSSYVTEVVLTLEATTEPQEIIVPITSEYYGKYYIKVTLDKSDAAAYRNHLYISEIRLQ